VPENFATPIDATTRYCAVYGHPIKHSASPAMQNAGIAALGLNWRYLAFDVHPDQLKAALEGARAARFVGINLTVPHKLLAMDFVDVLDDSAKVWGAVNTVRFEGRNEQNQWQPIGQFLDVPEKVRSQGFNTDAEAITQALEEDLKVQLHGASVFLLGAGGAGRTAALKIASRNVSQLYLCNRTESKALSVRDEIRQHYPAVKVTIGYPPGEVDLVLNATSLGLKPADPSPFDEAKFSLSRAKAVYDMIYRPAETTLLQMARSAGCTTANGMGMLLYQGAKALELWTGLPAPIEVMRRALEQEVRK
jgi:shikimate dehydrogenase